MFIDDKKIGTIPDNRILLREIVHVCVVVRNVEATAKKLVEKYGIGPFEVRKKTYPESHATIHGEPVSYTLKFGYCNIQKVVIYKSSGSTDLSVTCFLRNRGFCLLVYLYLWNIKRYNSEA